MTQQNAKIEQLRIFSECTRSIANMTTQDDMAICWSRSSRDGAGRPNMPPALKAVPFDICLLLLICLGHQRADLCICASHNTCCGLDICDSCYTIFSTDGFDYPPKVPFQWRKIVIFD